MMARIVAVTVMINSIRFHLRCNKISLVIKKVLQTKKVEDSKINLKFMLITLTILIT